MEYYGEIKEFEKQTVGKGSLRHSLVRKDGERSATGGWKISNLFTTVPTTSVVLNWAHFSH